MLRSNVETLKNGINFKIGDFVNMMCRSLGCILLAMIIAWRFSIVFLAIVPFMVIATTRMIAMIKKYTIEEFKSYGSAGRVAQEVLSSIRTVFAFGLERKSIQKYSANLEGAEQMAKKKGIYGGVFGGCSSGVFGLLFAIGIFYAIRLINQDCASFSPSNIIPSFFCMITAGFSLSQALPFLEEFAESKGTARRIFEIIETKSLIDVFDKKGKVLSQLAGDIEFEDVCFSYPQRQNATILNGLNLKIPAGKTVALVGSRYQQSYQL